METPQNIIVRMPNWLGDLVMATPVLADLRKQWPNATITAMCQSNVAPILKNDPNIDELFSFQRPNGWIPHQQHWNIINALRMGKYDLGVLLTNSFSSAWWFLMGKVKNRVGYKGNLRNFLLTQAIPFPPHKKTQHLVLTYKMLLQPLGIPLTNSEPQLYLSQEERDAADALLVGCGITKGKNVVVGINPGAAFGTAKCWLPERFREVTNKLLENPNVFVIYFGDPAGTPLVNDICKDQSNRVINMAGKTTLRELVALINTCSIFLTNDSGPMHIAAALKVPLLALFGSTDDVRTGPYGTGKVIHKHVECSPCYKRICPIDFRCMKRIGVDEVYSQLKEMIEHTNK
jgi:heptosyltransferase II